MGQPPSGPVESGCFGVMGAWSASPGLSAFSQLRGRARTGYGNEAHALAQRRCLSGLPADQIYSQVPANRHVRHVHAGHYVVYERGLTFREKLLCAARVARRATTGMRTCCEGTWADIGAMRIVTTFSLSHDGSIAVPLVRHRG